MGCRDLVWLRGELKGSGCQPAGDTAGLSAAAESAPIRIVDLERSTGGPRHRRCRAHLLMGAIYQPEQPSGASRLYAGILFYRYLESTANYLNELSSQEHLWTTAGAAVLLLSMAAIAAACSQPRSVVRLASDRDRIGSDRLRLSHEALPLITYLWWAMRCSLQSFSFELVSSSSVHVRPPWLSLHRRALCNAVRYCLALANSSSAPIPGLLEGTRGNRFDRRAVPQSPGMVPSGRSRADCQRSVSRIRMGIDLYRDL